MALSLGDLKGEWMDLDLSEGAFEWGDEDMSEGPQEYGGLGINERVEQSSSSHGLEGSPDRGGRREGCCIVKTTISVKVRLEEEFEQEWKERGELLRKKEVEYLEEQTKEGEREFEDIMKKERERVEAVLARRLDSFRTKEEGLAKAELEKRAQAAKGRLLEKLRSKMEDHRENRDLGNAKWRAKRCARIAEEMGLNKEVLRKERESKEGKVCRKEFRGERWEELGWSLNEHRGPKWTLTLKEEKCLREDL